MAKKSAVKTKQEQRLHVEIVRQMLTLATAGFGIVAALAWNSLIQDVINTYIKPYFPEGGVASLFIYAVVVTIIAVIVTLQLTKVLRQLETEKS